MWLTKKVKMIPGGEPFVPLWQVPFRWMLAILLSPIVIPLLVILYPLSKFEERARIRKYERDQEKKAKKREAFKRDVIVEKCDVDASLFELQRSDEFKRVKEAALEMMEIEQHNHGNRDIAMPPNLLVAWEDHQTRFPGLVLPAKVQIHIHAETIGAEAHLKLDGSDIKSDGTLNAFVQRTMLRHLSDQLYRGWHACYDCETIYNTRDQLSGVKAPTGVPREAKPLIDAFNFTPCAGKLTDGRWACEYVVYRPYGDDAGILRYRAVEDAKAPFGVYRAVVDRVDVPCFMRF